MSEFTIEQWEMACMDACSGLSVPVLQNLGVGGVQELMKCLEGLRGAEKEKYERSRDWTSGRKHDTNSVSIKQLLDMLNYFRDYADALLERIGR